MDAMVALEIFPSKYSGWIKIDESIVGFENDSDELKMKWLLRQNFELEN